MAQTGRFVRRTGIGGVRYRARLQLAEAELLRDVVSTVMAMLKQRLDESDDDELAALTGMTTGSATEPDYPPLARLLPNFFAPGSTEAGEDEAVSQENEQLGPAGDEAEQIARENAAMRMLHEPEIVTSKLQSCEMLMRSVPARGGTISLTEKYAQAWVQALNDVRLVLGDVLIRDADPDTPAPRPGGYRIGVPEHRPDMSDPMFPAWQAYHWTSMLQDDLLEAMCAE